MRASHRYDIIAASLLALSCAAATGAATLLDSLTNKDATGGLRAALAQGIDTAVAQLGAENGFLNDPKVAIPLPPTLAKAERALRLVGMGGEADELKATMNHAAEQAIAGARPIFKQALQRMTLADAKTILSGGQDAGTQYFRRTTSAQLGEKFAPIVARATARLRVASLYDRYAGKAAEIGLITSKEANLNDYVTAKALDGLFSRMADEELAIRKDPVGQANSLIKKVFGALEH